MSAVIDAIKKLPDQEIIALLRNADLSIIKAWRELYAIVGAMEQMQQQRERPSPIDVRRFELISICKIAEALEVPFIVRDLRAHK